MNFFRVLICLVSALLLVVLGFCGGLIFNKELSVSNTLDVISSLGSILAGFGTVFGVAIATFIGLQWKVQHRLDLFSSYHEGLNRFKNTIILSCQRDHQKIINNYPHGFEYTEADRRRNS